jgi:hypothetical protein
MKNFWKARGHKLLGLFLNFSNTIPSKMRRVLPSLRKNHGSEDPGYTSLGTVVCFPYLQCV